MTNLVKYIQKTLIATKFRFIVAERKIKRSEGNERGKREVKVNKIRLKPNLSQFTYNIRLKNKNL